MTFLKFWAFLKKEREKTFKQIKQLEKQITELKNKCDNFDMMINSIEQLMSSEDLCFNVFLDWRWISDDEDQELYGDDYVLKRSEIYEPHELDDNGIQTFDAWKKRKETSNE